MEHFIQGLYAPSNTAGIAAQPSFCCQVIAGLGAILNTVPGRRDRRGIRPKGAEIHHAPGSFGRAAGFAML